MNDNYLKIDKKTKIIIYGAAGNGMRGFYSLKVINGYNVIGFFDKRAGEILSQYNLPVWRIEEEIDVPKNQCVVFICIKNVFEHKNIVLQLLSQGYQYFVFKPIDFNNGDEGIESINRNYDKVFNDYDSRERYFLDAIPKIETFQYYNFTDYACIKSGSKVIANIPFEMIFVNAKDWDWGVKNCSDEMNAVSLFPHISLFNFWGQGVGDTKSYLDFCANTINSSEKKYGHDEYGKGTIRDTPLWRKSILSNRLSVFNKMNEALELDYNFFIDHAPDCELSDSGKFHIMSAKHRLAFFISKKRKYMPVRIAYNEYEKYLNITAAKSLMNYLKNNNIYETRVPIQHPYFYKYKASIQNFYEDFAYQAILKLVHYFSGIRAERIKVIDAIQDDGALARLFMRMGYESYYYSFRNHELVKHIDELMMIKTSAIEKLQKCDVLFIDDSVTIKQLQLASPSALFYVGNKNISIFKSYSNCVIMNNLFCGDEIKKTYFYSI